ncbi:N-6 DNA methylase [Flavobacterium sp. TP390]|uniref:site-specific DNA-methyltransferase (adenine-specific) n=1 Tax=Flavobacterium profundi TaxID=1774945 RepID=A0A6I4IFW6_9FLAO|nr:N-6 DNA methylase [Flavobacterium profundi]MVO08555.1 N-6 DNA methylase [Flavobacterium profundi]
MQIDSVLEKLNLLGKDGLFYLSDIKLKEFNIVSNRIKETLLKLLPNAIFCINNEPLILFFDNPKDLDLLEKQIWNFNQTPIVFIISKNQIQIKNGFNFVKNTGLNDLTDSNNISDFDYFKLITGESWEKYKSKFDSRKRIDSYLLSNIESARNILINKGLDSNVANSLIGRVIFIRYLIDRKVELNKYEILSKEQFYEILKNKDSAYKLFKQLRNDFNGNLFPLEFFINGITVNEEDLVDEEHLDVIISLLNGDKLISLNKKSEIQLSFFDIYDFSIIPIEFVSNVYEKFIGRSNQAEQGAYYTPLFLVDYIQKETVTEYFNSNSKLYNCRVLDPACGSGVFLVETLRQIILQYKLINPTYNDSLDSYKEELKLLLTENIFGIDKDENAIKVAIFSLYITLLDYLEPSSIVGFQFPTLLGTNFFVADFFDLDAEYNNILKNKHFQFILGNPPWGKVADSVKLYESYWKDKEKNEKIDIKVTDKQISQVFLIRVKDFSFDESALIVTSKILYNINAKDYRRYLLSNFKFRQVFELSSIAEKIFNVSNDSSIEPAVVLFYKVLEKDEELKSNLITHISVKPNYFFNTLKLLVIEKFDIKEVFQNLFLDYDWIWKTLVFGNILDFYFLKRLKDKNTFETINDIVSNTSHFIKGQGLKFKDGKRKIDTSEFSNYKFIGSLERTFDKNGNVKDTTTNYNKLLRQYYLTKNLPKWDSRHVGYFPDDKRIFNQPTLLITGGITTEYKCVSAIMYEDALFKSSLTAIKAINSNGINELKSICALLNSTFFSYYILSSGSSAGIERKESHDEEKWGMPFSTNNEIINLVSETEKLLNDDYESILSNESIKLEISKIYDEIDNQIFKSYNLSSLERSLVDYAVNISIPLRTGKKYENVFKKLNFKSSILENYAEIFLNHFGSIYNKKGHYFEIEIIFSKHTIAMYFRVTLNKSTKKIVWSQKGYKELLSTFTRLSFENVGQNLFIQKDIKGFENDGFYVIKPNEYKSWHPALAYLDLSEFIEALHNSKPKIDE